MADRTPTRISIVSKSTLAIDGELRPHQVVELFDENDCLFARYSRYLDSMGTAWVRHGVWQRFALDGKVVSQGSYVRGSEHGTWQDFYENGQLAAEGRYENGQEVGIWGYWDSSGNPPVQD